MLHEYLAQASKKEYGAEEVIRYYEVRKEGGGGGGDLFRFLVGVQKVQVFDIFHSNRRDPSSADKTISQ